MSDDGAAVVSYEPTGGYGAWRDAYLPASVEEGSAVYCPSPRRCVTVGWNYRTNTVALVGTPELPTP